jgi:hypothetical protein
VMIPKAILKSKKTWNVLIEAVAKSVCMGR